MNVEIECKQNHPANISDLMELYTDAGWENYTKDPDKLERAYKNSAYVAFAYDGSKLVGALRAVGDDETIMYVQDILLLKAYKQQGIGSRLMGMFLERYENVRQKGLLTDDTPETVGFYEAVGFTKSTEKGMVCFVRIE